MSESNIEFSEFNDEWLESFTKSTVLAFKLQCKLDIQVSSSFCRGDRTQIKPDIGAIIGITSAQFRGSAGLWFPKSVFLHLVSHMFNETTEEINNENEDAAAEFLNIIFGYVKTPMNQLGYEVEIAIPSIVQGHEIEAKYFKGAFVQVLPFQTQAGEFYVELLSEAVTPDEPPLPNIQESQNPLSHEEQAMFFMSFIQGTSHTLKLQCGLEIKADPSFQKPPDYHIPFQIASTIGITSKRVNGSYVMKFTQEVLLKLASKIFEEPITKYDSDIDDMVSELVNISLCITKRILKQEGHIIEMSLPTVIRGSDLQFSAPKKQKVTIIPFQSEIGLFYVEIGISS